jgi:hemoglobin
MTGTVYDAAGGYDGLLALAHAWHDRCMADPVVSHAFVQPGQHPHHLERLAAYWGEALGGPPTYTQGMGDETHVLRLHAGNGEHEEMDRRAEACFAAAVDDVGLGADPRLAATLTGYFTWANVAMAAHPRSPDDVAPGLPLPHWSWDGPVG